MSTKCEALRSLSVRFALSSFAATILIACGLFIPAGAQNIAYTENNIDQSLRGNLSVDPSTLGMSFSVPLGNYPGRGVSMPVTMSYASKVWRIKHLFTWVQINGEDQSDVSPRFGEYSVSGWTTNLDVPWLEYTGAQPYDPDGNPICTTCEPSPYGGYYVERIAMHMPDGSTHEMRKNDSAVFRYFSDAAPPLTGIYVSTDSARMKYDADQSVLYLPDGSRYWLAAPVGVQYIDRNGNTLNYNSSTKQWTDTTGRVISVVLNNTIDTGQTQKAQTISVPGFGTATQQYTLVWKKLHVLLGYSDQNQMPYTGRENCASRTLQSPYLFTGFASFEHPCGVRFSPSVLAEITLPNGLKYAFNYNIYGEITKVTLPTGGYYRYDYAEVGGLDFDNYNPLYGQANRGVTTQYFCETGACTSQQEQVWQYSATNNGSYLLTTVINPLGAKAEHYVHKSVAVNYFGFEDARAGRAYEERTYNASGQMLRRTLVEWTMTGPLPGAASSTASRDPRGTKKVEILLDTGGNALAATTTTSYDNDLNEISTSRYDYVSVNPTTAQTGDINSFPLGTSLRTEESTFLVNDTNIPQATRDAYRARHLIALPSYICVKNGSVTVAETQFKYDEYDETAYPLLTYGSTPTGWTNPNVNERGNVTTTRRWLNVSGSTVQTYPSGSYLETHTQYDQCGNVRNAWDAKGNLSQVDYTDNFSDSINRDTFAYATSSTTPVPDSSGYYGSNQSFTSSSEFDFQTGKIVTTTDANNKTTSYFYTDDGGALDSLQRLRKVTLPDGLGETKYEFGDTPGDLYIRTLTKQNATTWLEDRTNFDGMGRAKRSGHYEGPGSWSVKDTEYDTLGRIKRVTNPYFAANLGGATPGNAEWTTTTYDDLNRVLTVTTPDGSKVETTYSGNQVTVKDPADKKRRSVTDALGRLAQVVEDPDGVAYQTNYTFDALGNLTIVNQGGQYRYFFYDSLGRIVRAKNPEQSAHGSLNLTNPPAYNNSWSLGYSYDNNGNLTARTDANGVTTSHGYDALNRNVWTSYSDGVTPGLERHYDGFQDGSFVLPNAKGLFFYDFNYTVNPATGGIGYSRLIIGGYDALGRVTSQSQGFLANDGVTWEDFPVSRTYDLAGHVLTQNYPSTYSVNYGFGAGGRFSSAGGNLGGTSFTYADTISYNAAGQVIKERFGTQNAAQPSGQGLYHNLHYNNRLQLVDIRLGDSATDEWNWSCGAINFLYGTTAVDYWDMFASDTDNNGNPLRQINYVPLAGGGYVVSQLDDYTYDSLNRIATVTEAQMNSSGQWAYNVTSQTFGYDRWGNRLTVTGYNMQSWDSTEASATNRLKLPSGTVCSGPTKNGLCYDAAGNLIFDNTLGSAGDRTYDAEGRIITAAGGGLSKYVYDADGKRVRRQVGAQQFWQVYGIGGELVAEYLWDGTTATLQKEYGYRGGEMLIVAEGATVRWLVKDNLGTPRMIADQTGSLSGMRRHDYAPFGEELSAGVGIRSAALGYGADSTRQKFTGKERDDETGLDFFEARYYGSSQGRFTGIDPLNPVLEYRYPKLDSDILKPDLNDRKEKIENEKAFRHYLAHPQNWNLYVYVLNNPLAIIDPDGRGWKRSVDKDKDGNEVVSYYWMNNPDVHDVPDYYQYVDTKGRIIVLNGVSSNNWHEWGVMNLDGSITTGDQKANMTPAGYENYEMVKGSLMSAGYYMFIDPHPDHMNGVNFMTKDSPTLNGCVPPV